MSGSRYCGAALLILIEFRTDQQLQGLHDGFGVSTFGFDVDAAARSGSQHHQAHDRSGVHRVAILGDPHLSVKA